MNFCDIDLAMIDGKSQKMEAYHGKALPIVNVASRCGFTPLYEGCKRSTTNFTANRSMTSAVAATSQSIPPSIPSGPMRAGARLGLW